MLNLVKQNQKDACCVECDGEDQKYLDFTRGILEKFFSFNDLLIPYTSKVIKEIVVSAGQKKVVEGCDKYKFLLLGPSSPIKMRILGKYEENEFMMALDFAVKSVEFKSDDENVIEMIFSASSSNISAYLQFYQTDEENDYFGGSSGYWLNKIETLSDVRVKLGDKLDTAIGDYTAIVEIVPGVNLSFVVSISDENLTFTVDDIKLNGIYYSEKFGPYNGDSYILRNIKKYITLSHVYMAHTDVIGSIDSIELWNDTTEDITVAVVSAN